MAEKRESLKGVLNVRVDEALSREIDRIARVDGASASEAARQLIGYGVEVHRQVEASYLRLPYIVDVATTEGRVVIEASWKPYSPRELFELEMEQRDALAEEAEFGRAP